jgi:alpha-tubulin suppressor-like RCC1 family protein
VLGSEFACGLELIEAWVWCWGANDRLQLGTAAAGAQSATAVRPTTVSRFRRVDVGPTRACAITQDDEEDFRLAMCWGDNTSGALGIGQAVATAEATFVAGGYSYHNVSPNGEATTCGMVEDLDGGGHVVAGVYCWGSNATGMLGDPSVHTDQLSPHRVPDGEYAEPALGATFACAGGGGGVVCWGKNDGQLGDGTTVDRDSAGTVAGGRTFSALYAGEDHACALITVGPDWGRAWCWGRNEFGQLGDGTTTTPLEPVRVSGDQLFIHLALGHGTTCGLTNAQVLYCWGRNDVGQVGDGSTTNRLTPVRVIYQP